MFEDRFLFIILFDFAMLNGLFCYEKTILAQSYCPWILLLWVMFVGIILGET